MFNPIRYLMFTPAYPPLVGGVEKHLYEVHKSLEAKGLHGKIVVLHPPLSTDKDVIWLDPKTILKVPKTGRLSLYAQFINIVSQHPNAVLHFHDFTVLWPFVPIIKLMGWSKRTFITFHGWEGRCPLDPKVISKRQKCNSMAVGNIAVGDFIPKWYDTPADIVVYGGIHPQTSSQSNNAKNLPQAAAYMGRFEPDNGILEIVEALRKHYQVTEQKFPLHLYGSGSLLEPLKNMQRSAGLCLEISPPVSNVDAVLQQHPIIFASGYLTILEALYARRIVFAYYNNSLREDYLRLHPAANAMFICGSADDVRAGLKQLQEKPDEVYARAEESWQWAQTQTWDRLAESYIQLWDKAARP
jgi:glycosyltransferase involved in cell wall biosynthesis